LAAVTKQRLWWLLLALLLGAATAVSQGRPPERVEAHALLVRADPPVNSQLREPPTVLTLYFSEPLEQRFSTVRVVDQNGERVEERVEFDATDDALMRVTLRPLTPGYVTVLWENVSTVDGHRISGSYPLTILNEDGSLPFGTPPSVGASVSGEEARPARVVTKLVLLIGGCLLTGAFAFLAWVSPAMPGAHGEAAREAMGRRGRFVIATALALLIVAGVAELLLQADDIGAGIGTTLDTRWGGRWLLRNLLLVLPAACLLAISLPADRQRSWAGWGGLAGAAAYLLVAASVSHSAAGAGAFWGVASDFTHLVTASVWLGMLALLALLFFWARNGIALGERYLVLSTALQRFSVAAVVSLALLLFSGIVNAVIEVGRLADLVDTAYGRALLIKLVLILPLLAVAGGNAYLLRPRYVATGAGANQRTRQRAEELEQRLTQTVGFELAGALAVLLVVAVLVQLTPTRGRVVSDVQAGKFIDLQESAGISATLVIDPNEPGINTFEVYLTGAVDTVESVRLNFDPPGDSGEPSRLVLDPSNPPTFYVGRGPYITEPGRWRVEVDLRRNTGSDLAIPYNVPVTGAGGAPVASSRGGDFSSPFALTTANVALIAASGALALGIVYGSLTRPGLPAGYLGLLAERISEEVGPVRLRPAWSLFALVIMGVGLGLLLGSHIHGRLTPEQATEGNPVEATADSIARGRDLFLSNCTQCHGESGRGDGPLAGSLAIPPANLYDHIPYHPDQFFYSVMTNGLSGVMPAFGSQLSEEDRWNVLNYLRDEFGQPPPQSNSTP
jgi:copper transport protein